MISVNSTSVSVSAANNSTTAFNNTYNNGYENGFHTLDMTTTSEMTTNTTNNTIITSSSVADSPPRLINATANHHTFITAEADLSQLSLEIEKERTEYQEKSRHLQEQLEAFRQDIEELKVDDNMTNMDKIHREQQDQGNTKYSTIQKIKRGTTHSRVEIFEEL